MNSKLMNEESIEKKTYIYILKLVDRLYNDDKWTVEDNQIVEQHFLRLKKDYDNGKIIHVGRTTDPYKEGFGVVVFNAENDEVAKQYMLNDPAVKNGQMTAICKEYKVVFK